MRFWLVFRTYLWRRYHVPLPGAPGWADLVREVAAVPLWRSDDGLIGAPLSWSLVAREPSGRVVAVEVVCAWTGRTVSGATPLVEGGEVDTTAWGVRCARCRVPIAVSEAGMAHSMSIPSCPPCRSRVREAAR